MSHAYVKMSLAWIKANQGLPKPRGYAGANTIGINADQLFSFVNRANADAYHMRVDNHLVQHTGVISARFSVQHAQTVHMARSSLFPYVENYVLLDSNDEW